MKIVTVEFEKTVDKLIENFSKDDCQYDEELNLAKKFNALPIGQDMWSYILLTPDGEVLSEDLDGNPESVNDAQTLIRAIVSGASRYPELNRFIPKQPDSSKVCVACNGTKLWGQNISTKEPARCVICAGLGWITFEEFSKITINELKRSERISEEYLGDFRDY